MSKFVTLHGFGGGSGGTELNFEIVGGTTEPSNPTENMIWINTDVEITSWLFSTTEPTTPTNGMAWISVSISSPVEFNIFKQNGFNAYPILTKQYVNSTWIDRTTKSYQSGKWIEWVTYLYNLGLINTDLTGGLVSSTDYSWANSSQMFAEASFNYDHISCTGVAEVRVGGVGTKNPINLTGYNKLCVDANFSAVHSDNSVRLSKTKSTIWKQSTAKKSCEKTGRNIIELDISSYNESMYITVTATLSYNVKIYRIWLE